VAAKEEASSQQLARGTGQQGPLPKLASRKGEWLLALLALREGRGYPRSGWIERSWLRGILWPDSAEEPAQRNLRNSLADLRRALGPAGSRLHSPTSQTLALDLSAAQVDVAAFDRAMARVGLPALEEAIALYRGPLLEGCAEEWAFQERRVREQAYLQGLETLAAAAMERGDAAAAEGYLGRAVSADPLRETAQRQLMLALAAGGNHAAALMRYRDLRVLLHREVNAEPDPETQALFQQLRAEARRAPQAAGAGTRSAGARQASASTAAHRRTAISDLETQRQRLPAPLTCFIGREWERAELKRLLGEETLTGARRLVTLTGAGGCGKTRLAFEIAADLLEEFAGGVWLVELAPLADPALVPQTVAAALELQEEPGRPLLATLTDFLRPKALLLVLDNCEHLLTACARLAEALLKACPQLRILATSREGLDLVGEQTYRVPSLSVPADGSLLMADGGPASDDRPGRSNYPQPSTINEYEAVALFVDRAALSQPSFALTEANAAAVAQICQRLDGIPLAIELAAALVKSLPVGQIAARLDDRFRLLTGGSRTGLPRQQTLRSSMDWSYDLLIEPERRLLQRLSLFAGGWTLEAAEAVTCDEVGGPCGDCGLRIESGSVGNPQSRVPSGCRNVPVLELLTSLVNKSLVVYQEREGHERYRLLETVRQYSHERLLESGEETAVRTRHRDWFLAFAEQAEPELLGSEQRHWLERLEREHDNLRTALAWCQTEGNASADLLRFAGALRAFWNRRGYLIEGRSWVEAALRQSEGASPILRARALNTGGALAHSQGDYLRVTSFCERALALAREAGDSREAILALTLIGCATVNQGDLERGTSRLLESRALALEAGDVWGQANAAGSLGYFLLSAGECGQAVDLLKESLALGREIGERVIVAYALWNLGEAALRQGEYAEAQTTLQESLLSAQEGGDKRCIAGVLTCLAKLAAADGAPERAVRLFAAAQALREAVGTPLEPGERADEDRSIAATRATLGDAAYAAAWAEGNTMQWEQAIEYALGWSG
jgi:predicted ATPase/DNA-binding SARP family transcriptional activator